MYNIQKCIIILFKEQRYRENKRYGQGIMTKHWIFLCFFLGMAPFGGNAQTPPDSGIPVMLMPFTGDDLAISGRFHDELIREIETMSNYTPLPFSAGEEEALDLPPDAPPDAALLGESRYVVTGEYYVDTDAMRHFQIWLWESTNGALTYTDEMVFEEMEEADMYFPPLVTWVFSKITVEAAVETEPEPEAAPETEIALEPAPETEAALEPEPDPEPVKPIPARRLYLGLHGGLSLNTYASLHSENYATGVSQNMGFETAAALEFRVLRFLSFQAEAVFNYDMFDLGRTLTPQNTRITDTFNAMSLRFPLLIKIPLDTGFSTPAIFAGAYYILPLGKMNIRYYGESEEASSSVKIDLPLGIVVGIELSFPLGPGEIFTQMRYERDLDITRISEGKGGQYVRSEAGLSLGYKFILWQAR